MQARRMLARVSRFRERRVTQNCLHFGNGDRDTIPPGKYGGVRKSPRGSAASLPKCRHDACSSACRASANGASRKTACISEMVIAAQLRRQIRRQRQSPHGSGGVTSEMQARRTLARVSRFRERRVTQNCLHFGNEPPIRK